MKIAPAEIDQVLQALAENPSRLEAAAHGLDTRQLNFKATPEDWSVSEILAHPRAAADVWGKSIMAMVTQDHPTMRYVSPRTWMRKTSYAELPFRESLSAYLKQRQELLQILHHLKPQDWARGATFTATTKGREQNVFSYAQRIVNHETEHCRQIEALLKGETTNAKQKGK